MIEDSEVPRILGAHPDYGKSFACIGGIGDPIAEPEDISDAVVYLASDMSRQVTGIALPVDMGATVV
jgi:hypothetical protein